ncbi:palmitoyl-protein hydrolase [Ranunculus cassubicifolius]
MANLISIAAFFFLVSLPYLTCLPFIVLHGLGDECSSEARTEFTENLSNWSGSKGYCM